MREMRWWNIHLLIKSFLPVTSVNIEHFNKEVEVLTIDETI